MHPNKNYPTLTPSKYNNNNGDYNAYYSNGHRNEESRPQINSYNSYSFGGRASGEIC